MNAPTLEKQVLSIICSVFDAHSAVLFLPEEEGDACRLADAFTLGEAIPQEVVIRPGGSLVGWIISTRTPMLEPNLDQLRSNLNLGYYDDGVEASIKAFMGCPVPGGGALCVDSKRQYSFSDKDQKILQLFAELIARLQVSRGGQELSGDIPRYFAELGVIQDLRFRYRRWPRFLENFLRTVRDATGFDYCAFASIEASGDRYCVEAESARLLLTDGAPLCLPVGSGIVGMAFLNDQPVFAESSGGNPVSALFGKVEGMPEFQTAVCLPVVVNKSTRGVLCLAHTESAEINEGMRSFVRQAVDHLALFLENLYLRTRLMGMLPRATVQSDGATAFDPDAAPEPPREEH